MTTTTNWILKPFTANGINFVSKLDADGDIYQMVTDRKVSDEHFMAMNRAAVADLWAMHKNLSVTELLELVNKGGTSAFIELAGE